MSQTIDTLLAQGYYDGDNIQSITEPLRALQADGWVIQHTFFHLDGGVETTRRESDLLDFVGVVMGLTDDIELLLSDGRSIEGMLTLTIDQRGDSYSIVADDWEPSDEDDEDDEDEGGLYRVTVEAMSETYEYEVDARDYRDAEHQGSDLARADGWSGVGAVKAVAL